MNEINAVERKLEMARIIITELSERMQHADEWPKHTACVNYDATRCYACGLEANIATVMSRGKP